MNEGKRLLSVFIAPVALFEDLRQKPRWLVPFAVLIVVSLASALVQQNLLLAQIGGSDALVEMAKQQNSNLSEDLVKTTFFVLPPVVKLIVNLGLLLIFALVFWALFLIFGSDLNFKRSFSAVSYASLITSLGMIFIAVLSLLLQRVDVSASLGLLPIFKPGTYFSRLAAEIDFFVLWWALVLGAGFAILGRVSRVKSYFIVIAAWLVFAVALSFIRFGPRQ